MAPYCSPSWREMVSRLFSISLATAAHALSQPRQFLIDRVAHDKAARDAKSLVVHNERFANRYAGRNGNSLQRLHLWRRRADPLTGSLATRRTPRERSIDETWFTVQPAFVIVFCLRERKPSPTTVPIGRPIRLALRLPAGG